VKKNARGSWRKEECQRIEGATELRCMSWRCAAVPHVARLQRAPTVSPGNAGAEDALSFPFSSLVDVR
jgi:hypothetical protein